MAREKEVKPVQEEKPGNLPLYLFRAGKSRRAYEYLGVHKATHKGKKCMVARVWAPTAQEVSLVGDFCNWDQAKYPLHKLDDAVWEGYTDFVFEPFTCYKFFIKSASGEDIFKADPYALHAETRPGTASRFVELDGYKWGDDPWLQYKKEKPHYNQPVNIYEVHAGSWRRYADGSVFSYDKLGDELIPYVKEMGFTHIEFMRLLGLPGHGLFCPHLPLRPAQRLHALCGPLPPGGHRRHPGLGPLSLPSGRRGPGQVRRLLLL